MGPRRLVPWTRSPRGASPPPGAARTQPRAPHDAGGRPAAASVARLRIRVGHSADPDDAFMFWALEAGRVESRGLEIEQVVSDIQTLNEWATEGRLEVTAISLGAYPHVADRYLLLPHGASMGEGYGPVVVARAPVEPAGLRATEIVIPG